MSKISHEDKMQIQTFQHIGFGYRKIVTNFPEKGWKLNSVKAICLSFFVG